MIPFAASAPGKLVLSGEYAVLEGAPAVVVALERRASAHLSAGHGEGICLAAPDIGINCARGHCVDGQVCWPALEAADRRRLAVVDAVLERAWHAGADFEHTRIELDTGAFFAPHGETKLGLGSSAALSVALAGAWTRAHGLPSLTLRELIELHRSVQGGRGSGLDIAAALQGGVLDYRLENNRPYATPLVWPQDLHMRVVFSGRSASTGAALARLAQWREAQPKQAGECLDRLCAAAERCATRMAREDSCGFVDALKQFTQALDALGKASGIDIVSVEHRQLAGIADRHDLAWKPCGAGGGDVGVAVGVDPARLRAFQHDADQAGFRVLDTSIATHGLSVAPLAHSAV